MRTVLVPLHRLRVPLADFGEMLSAAGHLWHAHQTNRYLGAVRMTLEWVAGIHDQHPLTREHQPGEPDAMLNLQMQADAIVYDWPEALPDIHPQWALGVAAAIGWTRGASPRPPIPMPKKA